MVARSRLRIGASCDWAMISRIADSDTARIVGRGSRRLNRYLAGSEIFQTTWKSMSTTFSSPVSMSPASLPRWPVPISSVCSRVTGMTS